MGAFQFYLQSEKQRKEGWVGDEENISATGANISQFLFVATGQAYDRPFK
jgi:hypothetical protein